VDTPDIGGFPGDALGQQARFTTGNLAAQEDDVIIAGDVDVAALQPLLAEDTLADGQLDFLVTKNGAGAAPVVRDHHSRGRAASHQGHAALQDQQAGEDQAGGCKTLHRQAPMTPNKCWSIKSHKQWITSRCTSWMRAVAWEGTRISMSPGCRMAAMAPPSRPVRATTRMSRS